MTDEEKSTQITGKERFVYFILIPLLFTAALITTGSVIIRQGKSESFTNAVLQAGQQAIHAGQSVTKLSLGNKQAPQTSSPASSTAGQSNAASSPVGQQPSTNTQQQTPTGSQQPSSGSATSPSPSSPESNSSLPQPDTSAAFKQKTDEMASEYSTMSPAQAASILGNMGLKDEVFTMLGMKAQQRANILAKMDPKQAAALSKTLENFPSGTTGDMTAMQKQLDQLPASSQPMDELVKTYSQMPVQSAAILITELMKTNQKEAIGIMSNLDSATRANVLSAMSANKTDPNSLKFATQISEFLMQNKSS